MQTEQDQVLDLSADDEQGDEENNEAEEQDNQVPVINNMSFPVMEMPNMKLDFCAI